MVLGVMIHPLYVWHPDGTRAGYPAGSPRYPWKWWPVAPAYQHPERAQNWRVSIGGCHRPGEPYLWVESGSRLTPGITTDGGPVWAWPGVVEGTAILRFIRELAGERAAASGLSYKTPLTGGSHTLGYSEYHPPVPCQDIWDGKYEPDHIDFEVNLQTYRRWMPAVGDQPHPDWEDPPDNPFAG